MPESDPELVSSEAISKATAAFGHCPKCGSDRSTALGPLLNQVVVRDEEAWGTRGAAIIDPSGFRVFLQK